ncbi:MAG: hypothetical protein ACT4OJ_08765 [Bacteroidota bacterium]
MKTKKIDKDYLITDSSVNIYGFRLLTEGYLKSEFEKNPIGYYMHNREDGVVVRWEDLHVDGDKVYGKPVINLSNERGQQTVDEIEGKFLNGASVGHIVALEISEDPKDMLPGQCGPTITKWFNRECSLVDVPGNMDALALYDKEGNTINLADFKTKTPLAMKQIFLSAAQLAMIPGLKANPEQADLDAVFKDLVDKATLSDSLRIQLTAAQTEVNNLKGENNTLKTAGADKEVTDMLKAALDGPKKKITKEQHDLMAVQFKGKPAELKAFLDATPELGGVVKNLKTGDGSDAKLKKFEGKTFTQLDEEGLLEDLKAADEGRFYDVWKEHFGTAHKQDKREA